MNHQQHALLTTKIIQSGTDETTYHNDQARNFFYISKVIQWNASFNRNLSESVSKMDLKYSPWIMVVQGYGKMCLPHCLFKIPLVINSWQKNNLTILFCETGLMPTDTVEISNFLNEYKNTSSRKFQHCLSQKHL